VWLDTAGTSTREAFPDKALSPKQNEKSLEASFTRRGRVQGGVDMEKVLKHTPKLG